MYSAGIIRNCLIHHNYAGTGGGGVYIGYGTSLARIENCSIIYNEATVNGGLDYFSNGPQIFNSILYDNINGNWSGGSFSYSCTTPLPTGTGNIDIPPLFRNPAVNDFRLQVSSPCIDAGANQTWMTDGQDLNQKARLVNSTVDMGAYELTFNVTVRLLLQGPYNTTLHQMNPYGSLPSHSPYAADNKTLPTVTNATDWVLLELRSESNAVANVYQSVYLRNDGYLIDGTGASNIFLNGSPDESYYVVVKHRNHLTAMSAQPIPFAERSLSYDFTIASAQFFGGTTNTTELEPGIWGVPAGDADGDGQLLPVDQQIHQTQLHATGYYRSDFDLDGIVTPSDLTRFWASNLTKQATAPNPEVSLHPSLVISPPRKTVLPGEAVDLQVLNETNTYHWAFVHNESGASLTSTYASTNQYIAGSGTSSIDVVEAWHEDNPLGRVYFNVISTQEVAAIGKAIIFAGGSSLADRVWHATHKLANRSYEILRERGFSAENINYLSFGHTPNETNIDGTMSILNASNAFTSLTAPLQKPDRLFVYLVDHGEIINQQGAFRLNPSEYLSAGQLKLWLDHLQAQDDIDITVVLDFCYAGSFVPVIAPYTGNASRTIIASSASNELTYFVADGTISFSSIFFSGIDQGLSLWDAFELARIAMSPYQNAEIEDNQHGAIAQNTFIGSTFAAGKNFPIIGSAPESQLLNNSDTATLWVDDIKSSYLLHRVWCTILPPSYQPDPTSGAPVTELIEVDLIKNETTGRYEAEYDAFDEPGIYQINFYAQDIWLSVSPPKPSTVVQDGIEERLILIQGDHSNSEQAQHINQLANQVYVAFKKRLFHEDSIQYLSHSPGTNIGTHQIIVDAKPTLHQLHHAITNWAEATDILTVYFIGDGTNNLFRINPSQEVHQVDLQTSLNTFQNLHQELHVIFESPGSGSYIPYLIPPTDAKRVLIASSAPHRENSFDPATSFTGLLMTEIQAGESLGRAVYIARRAVRRATGNVRQKVLIDDNGNGLPNEKSIDGLCAEEVFFGSAFFTGSEIPQIEEVTPPTTLDNGTELLLWAQVNPDTNYMERVWCSITTPTNNLSTLATEYDMMFNPVEQRYELLFDDLYWPGLYSITFHARNTSGEVAPTLQTEIFQTTPSTFTNINTSLPDEYEPDSRDPLATYTDLPAMQYHTFHTPTDKDWVKFYAMSNYVYDIETVHVGTNQHIDTILEVYHEVSPGNLVLVDYVDEFGTREGELTGLDFPSNGFYYVRVSQYPTSPWEPDGYMLYINIPTGLQGTLTLVAVNILNQQYITSSQVTVAGQTHSFGANGAAVLNYPTIENLYGQYASVAPPNLFDSLYHPLNASLRPENPYSYYGNPRLITENSFTTHAYAGVGYARYSYMGFFFIPKTRITAQVVNAHDGNPIPHAFITFQPTSELGTNNQVYDRYPWASYGQRWETDINGYFSADVWLLPHNSYNLWVQASNFDTFYLANAAHIPQHVSLVDLGSLSLTPSGSTPGMIQTIANVRDEYSNLSVDNATVYFCKQDTGCDRGDLPTPKNPGFQTLPNGDVSATTSIDHNLMFIQKLNYHTTSVELMLSSTMSETNIGIVYMRPTDDNTNAIPDAWEYEHYGRLLSSTTEEETQDTDMDGHNNYEEYLIGSNPTDPESSLQFSDIIYTPSNRSVTLRWDANENRTYYIHSQNNMTSTTFTLKYLQEQQDNTFSPMSWTDYNVTNHTLKIYRLHLYSPYYYAP